MSGVKSPPFTDWVVRQDCCALLIRMNKQVPYANMLHNIRRWCGRPFMASLRWWDLEEAEEVVPRDGCAGRQLQERMVMTVRSIGSDSSLLRSLGTVRTIHEHGYVILRNHVPQELVDQALSATRQHVASVLALLDTPICGGPDCSELLRVHQNAWIRSPSQLTWAKWGPGRHRGWAADFGGGKMFREASKFPEHPDIVQVQETARAVVACLHKVPPQSLLRLPEGASVKPAGCPELEPHWDPHRRGTYQVVIALSSTALVVYPGSHLYEFSGQWLRGRGILRRHCIATAHDLQWLQGRGILPRVCSMAPGDMLVFQGGRMVHSIPKTPQTMPTRFCIYARFSLSQMKAG